MTATQLAHRLNISQPTVFDLERSEVAETISLKSLRKMAEAMGCTLVYAFVPHESLEKTVRDQAYRRAAELIGRVEHSMRLEVQGRDAEILTLEQQELAEELIRTLRRELWESKNEV